MAMDTVAPPSTAVAEIKPEARMMAAAPAPEVAKYELALRKAKLYASSPLVPAHLRGANITEGTANCYIALAMADAMGENELVVLQSIYIVHGRAGWAAQYMIARANASGVFKGGIRFAYSGEKATRSCRAYGTLAETGDTVEFTVGMEMAKAEGWTKNSKYTTMPDLMLSYRAATLLVRLYCPHVMLGYQTREEAEDVIAAMQPEKPKISIAQVTSGVDPDEDDEPAEDESTPLTNGQLFENRDLVGAAGM